ncbi:hypothetical protein GCM10025868_21810 [Angustibacter aerolatus]|uniref:DUF2029 domain-containing protein n=1 Tax=Angustibacter aerolatus TaxID=1162965 RepID=A0ABQ6JJF1_9ACTN|nr:glycosyltransferase 87 family protein [Angustibacter aerolatus]GMA86931.1 hypothetical protein GCM10025868_21810 [Angustibacter aerolatus]
MFLLHLAWSRRWREPASGRGRGGRGDGRHVRAAAAGLAGVLGGALTDPTRLGPNAGTSNQSIRGVLLRLGPDGTAGTALWLVCVLLVGALGFTVARRFADRGERMGEVAAMGLMAVLLSPVAWIHHYAWMTVVVAALVADGRSRRRTAMAGVVLAWFLCRFPWWGVTWIQDRLGPVWVGRLLQNAYLLGALVALGLLWQVTREGRAPRPATR